MKATGKKETLVWLFLSLLTTWLQAVEIGPQEIYRKTHPSVALLSVENADGQLISVGSGFFVRTNLIISNIHVVEGGFRCYAKIAARAERLQISEVVAIDQQNDLVLLRTHEGAAVPHLKIGDDSELMIGDSVFAIGNPLGLEGTLSAGILSGIRRLGSNMLFQITAPISSGSSGGASAEF